MSPCRGSERIQDLRGIPQIYLRERDGLVAALTPGQAPRCRMPVQPTGEIAKMSTTLPNRIRECRQRAKLSMRALARQLGTTPSQVDKLERGTRRLTLEWMLRIAMALDCHPIEFFPSTVDQRSQTDRWLDEYGIAIGKTDETLHIKSLKGIAIQVNFPDNKEHE